MSKMIQNARKIKEDLQTMVCVPPEEYDFIVTYPQTGCLQETSSSLEGVSQIDSTGIYVTASPYCPSVCSYCPYTSGRVSDPSQTDIYLDNLIQESELRSSDIKIDEVTSIYFGGGTPSLLSESQIERLVMSLYSTFNIKPDSEISFEVSPNTLVDPSGQPLKGAEHKLRSLRDSGINRVSIGVQTFNDDIDLNRNQNSNQAIRAIGLVSEYFENFNVDMMHGLPHQSLESWEQDLNTLLKCNTPSITIYQTILQHPSRSEARRTNLARIYRQDPTSFPTSDENLLMRIMAIELLRQEGYSQNLIGWFVRDPANEQQQQISKWNCGNYLGLGAKAYSYVEGEVFVNHGDVRDYIDSIKRRNRAVERGKVLTDEELMRRTVIFSLKSGGLEVDDFNSLFGESPLRRFGKIFSKLAEEGLAVSDSKRIELTYNGMLFADRILKQFF